MKAISDVLGKARAESVLDLGCGEGNLLVALARGGFTGRIVGVDRSKAELRYAAERLESLSADVTLIRGSVLSRDPRYVGFDAVCSQELIEHLRPEELESFMGTMLEHARPKIAIITTPNAEFNSELGLSPGELRHPDHEFEWDRKTFRAWARDNAARFGYSVRFTDAGPVSKGLGAPTQIAVFTRKDPSADVLAGGLDAAWKRSGEAAAYQRMMGR